jgi:HEAT repeat protein
MVNEFQHVVEQLRSSDEETRRLAVVSLAGHPFGVVREALFTAMGDESWRVRKEAVDCLLAFPFSPEIGEVLVEMLRSHDNAGMRNSAVEALERLGGKAVPILSRHVNDTDHDVRKFVIDILGHTADPSSVGLLITALGDPDPNVSAAAAENLGKIGDVRAIPPLLRALESEALLLRFTVLEALGRIGKPVPLAKVTPLATDPFLKKAVFDCLGVIGDAEAVPLLVAGVKERARSVREAAVIALGKVKDRLAPERVVQLVTTPLKDFAGSPVVDSLVASLETGDPGLKEAVITVLGIIGDPRAVRHLLRVCRDDRLRRQCLTAFTNMGEDGIRTLLESFDLAGDDERCLIIYVCGELGCRDCTAQLRKGLLSPYYLLRKISVAAAGRIGLTGMVDEIAGLLDDAEPEVREAAIDVLARFAPRDGTAILTIASRLAAESFPEKRRNAAVLFAALGDGDKLSFLVKDEEASVRKAAITALARLRSRTGIGHLVMALADEDADVRIAVAEALGVIGGDEVLEPLLLSLRDDDLWVQCAALKALARLGSDAAFQALVDTASRADGLVLVTALEALAEAGGERAFAEVRKGLDSADEDVVKTAIAILARDGDDWIEEYREKLLAHPHWDVRSSFARELAAKWGARSVPALEAALATESDELVKGQIRELLDRLRDV